jgi:hypothetical protein
MQNGAQNVAYEVTGSREDNLVETEGAQSNASFRHIIPAVIFETARWQLGVAAKTVYSSSSSDNEEIMGSFTPTCLLLQESPVRQWVSESVLSEMICENLTMCTKNQEIIQLNFSDI